MQGSVWALAVSAVLVASCGGGGSGDETLYVALSYPDNEVSLYRESRVQPDPGGFEGHAPRCSLAGGRLPPGMHMGGDCVISGRPLEDGMFSFTVKLGASGASNTLETGAQLIVHGPMVEYPQRNFLHTLSLGESVRDAPSFENWRAAPDLQASWSYWLADGELPPGLTLDAATGRITGKARAEGIYTASIQAQLVSQFGTYRPVVSAYPVSVRLAAIGYAGGDPERAMVETLYISQPARLYPVTSGAGTPSTTFSNFTLDGTLPAGLVLDARTGVISGTPTGPEDGGTLGVRATLHNGGVSAPTEGTLRLSVRSPVRYEYPADQIFAVNTLARMVPMRFTVGGEPLSPSHTVTFRFVPGAGCPTLPPGMTLDPTSGTLSGRPGVSGSYACLIEQEISNNGVSWTVSAGMGMYVP